MHNKNESLQTINNTDVNSFMNLKLNELIEDQVVKTPDAEAVCYEGTRLSFNNLNARANQVAHQLRRLDVSRNEIVAVLVDRSLEMAVALVGILKSGGAYLPLDPETPKDRLDFILQDANVSVVLTQQKYSALLDNIKGHTLSLDSDWDNIARNEVTNLVNINQAEDLAYIIYTSGSTGKPKGCMLPHQAICNRLLWMKQQYQVNDADRILQKTPYTFDVSVWELFLPLLAGACLVFAKPRGHKDNAYLIDLIQQENITICHFVPSMLRFFLNQSAAAQCHSLKHVFASGEALPYELTAKFIHTIPAKLHNLYGPTEAAVDVSYWQCELRPDRKVPIGRPISNIQLYILDENFQLVETGESGELYIGGIGLALGYLNRKEITEKAFIDNPLPPELSSSRKLYRTGDEARFLPDGNIEYLGRLDSQVKLRGFRIELGEIENTINQHKDIEHSVVLVKGEGSINPELVAYIVSRSDITLKQIRAFLKPSLPEYMLPNAVIRVKEIPVTTHGKADRKALLQLSQKMVEEKNSPISSATESTIKAGNILGMNELIKDLQLDFISLLDIETLDIEEDLFELGATSFTMVQMVEKIQNRHDINIPVEVFLDTPTIKAIANYLDTAIAGKDTSACKQEFSKNEQSNTEASLNIDDLAKKLHGSFTALLDVQEITIYDDLFEHGATSFTMVQVVEEIQNEYTLTIPVEVFLDNPTIHAIASYLLDLLRNKLDQESDKETPSSQMKPAETQGRTAQFKTVLLKHFNELLDTQKLMIDDDLFEHGATSFTMVQVVEKIQNDFSVTVPVEVFLDNPTVEAISIYLENKIKEETESNTVHDDRSRANKVNDLSVSISFSQQTSKIQLKECDFSAEAYNTSISGESRFSKSLTLEQFGRFISLLRQENVNQEGKYLYASAGGLNPIQTYVYVKKNGVDKLEQGIYYYHPKQHSLVPIGSGACIDKDIFFEYDHHAYDNAGFMIFFIAQMKALLPIYKDTSSTLSVLEAGYMGQLLTSRHTEYDLTVSPASGVNFNAISHYFDLDENHQFIHCLFGGTSTINNVQVTQAANEGLYEYLRKTNKSLHSHCTDHINPLNLSYLSTLDNGSSRFPTKEEKESIQNDANIRRFPENIQSIKLTEKAFGPDYYKIRSTKREYLEEAVSFDKFSKFLTLLRPKSIDDNVSFLYSSVTSSHLLKIYLYIKENGVQGLRKGLYYYDPEQHELTLVTPELSTELKSCYTPFNRKHVAGSKFSLFLVSPEKQLKESFKDDSNYLALLDAGYIGQLLMDRQAEFDIGVCPIGGILFDKIRDDFQLDPEDQLLHSFVCGSHVIEMPAGWKFLEAGRRENHQYSSERFTASSKDYGVDLRQDIAIVGLSGRFPGAENLDQFWKNLEEGRDSFKELSFEREGDYRRSDLENQSSHRFYHQAAFLNEIDCFDSRLFNISPLEARSIDPQERLLLEVVWECLENSGYTSEALNRVSPKVGVFVGAMWDDYQHHSSHNEQADQSVPVISLHSSIANNISHFFQLNGPSIALNTSCSSAMTAIHYACTSIKNRECSAAIVGGVNIMSHPYHHQTLQGLDLLSKDGHSNPFGKNGTGFVAGEGVGAILIKPRIDAERDGDYIHGIIKGTAVGFSGRGIGNGSSKPKRQKESMLNAIENSGVPVSSISYIEAAAPGASLADATEITALKEAFHTTADDKSIVYIGSVKSNIGHLESASAMSQVMKVLLQMKRQKIFPTINVGPVNPLIQLKESGLEIINQLKSWDPIEQKDAAQREIEYLPRRALINAFGATGSGGHAVIEEYINSSSTDQAGENLIMLSAATEQQLIQLAQRLRDYLMDDNTQVPSLADIAYTLRVGRTEMVERIAMVVKSHGELVQKLQDYIDGLDNIVDFFKGTGKQTDTVKQAQKQMALKQIAQNWVLGTKFSWENFNAGNSKRVPLPTYPFAKERHWIKKESNALLNKHVGFTPIDSFANGNETSAGEDILFMEMSTYLKAILSGVSEIPVSQIDSTSTFDEYGINSFMITKLNFALEKDFGELSKTLFFEYQTIQELAKYFLSHHFSRVTELLAYTGGNTSSDKHNAHRNFEDGSQTSSITFSEAQTKQAYDIAIVGLCGKFPQSENVEAYWENLKNAVDCISEIPTDRWDYRHYYEEDKTIPGKIHSKWGGFISGIDEFDPLFFNISPREAEFMDPQERLFLQTVWHTFEDAGYVPSSKEIAKRKIGVFVGVMYGEYQLFSNATNKISSGMAVGASYGTIANRISYVFNLTGPSMAIDTLCSSSLTALHLAVNSIKNGESEAAIVGGVNLSIHPNKYIMQAQGNMSSSEGRCRSFGEGGDGFVASEGVGAIFIKPLPQSIADKDNIYAIIKGTSINNDGKTHGYTVPNPNAHAEMILDALKTSNINPECISYVEAHGTGTSLGDPVEITGLTKAFSSFTSKTEFCAIGSAKSNIGHTEAAAGIAGITKILLQMKHKTLVPSLHSQKLNPNINFEKSPFYVQQELNDWERPNIEIDGKLQEFPRIACISSLGAGGSNAHAIIQEYTADETIKSHKPSDSVSFKVIIPLSAKNKDRLQEYVETLVQFIQKSEISTSHIDLVDLAYTLQVGREPMEERLGLVVSSLQELNEKLVSFIEGKKNLEGVYQGRINKDKNILSVFTYDEDMSSVVETWISKAKYHKILDLWVKGFNVDWSNLYKENKPRRISAPQYPFAKERYWVENNLNSSELISYLPTIHPLLHSNTSDLSEQRFTSKFNGTEFFLKDHVIKGDKILPGVGYLEMARAAVAKASGITETDNSIQLENVVWTQPIIVNGLAKEIHIGLAEGDNEKIHYEIYSESEDGEEIIHSQGTSSVRPIEESSRIEISEIQSLMTKGVLDADTCYQAFNEMGIQYGEGHRAIQTIFKGDKQVLAKLSLPSSLVNTQHEYILHPSLMDSAIQSSIGLMLDNELPSNEKTPLKASLPFALESLTIISSCTSDMYAWVRLSNNTSVTPASTKVQKLDIDLCDEQGNVCVRMKGFSSRALDGNIELVSQGGDALKEEAIGTLLTIPAWQEASVSSISMQDQYSDHLIWLCELEDIRPEDLNILIPGSDCRALTPRQSTIESRYTDYAATCFERIKELLQDKSQGKSLIQIILPNTPENSLFLGLSSLLKTAALENPRITGQIIQVDSTQSLESVARTLKENLAQPDDAMIKYENQRRWVLRREERNPVEELTVSNFKEGGVYLITGGLGALGLLFAKEILKHTNNATLVITGRSELTIQKQSAIRELETNGAHVEYHSIDVSKLDKIRILIESIEQNHRALDGIIHCAGVISDNFILKKSKEEFENVLAAKVAGTMNLDVATYNMNLDFFVLFSSTSAIHGNYGQADYATANAFMDQFAQYRNTLVLTQKRCGHTLSINWPLWKDGGMHIDASSERMMRETTGMIPMRAQTGVRAFYQALRSGDAQVSVAEGDLEKMRRIILETRKSDQKSTLEDLSAIELDPKTLEEKAQHYLKKQFSSVLKLALHKIDSEAPLEEYGMDSILAVNLTNQLEKTFGSLPKTLFFEYQTISELSSFFVQSYQSKLLSLLNTNLAPLLKSPSMESSIKTLRTKIRKRKRFSSAGNSLPENTALDIAIVGLSGRYPLSRNLQEYWNNLQSGKDCITEIPKERWDWKEYYTEDKSKAGAHYSKWGGFIEGVDEFDPLFFNITPLEAMVMDPQERLFLQHAWMALEDAGYTRESLQATTKDDFAGQIGVYAGVMYSEYQLFGAEESLHGNRRAIAGSLASIANRVSYVLNLHGPSMTVDTMCSSSLTSIHLACQDLKHHKTHIGIAGGVNVTIHPNKYLGLSATGFISAKGRCESFGEGGEGYIPGEGVGVVLLKRLQDAINDKDHIYGVILGSAINHGGKTNGYTVPNPKAQRSAIEMALSESNINPNRISYIEAHGTGTKLGDPIEIAALSQAFGKFTKERGFCRIGSAKSNIGHCEGAAGIAGLTKILLQMKYHKIVPSLHSSTLNSNIEFAETPFVVNQTLRDWQHSAVDHSDVPLTAAVSSFGAGGSNAHLIVTEFQSVTQTSTSTLLNSPVVIPLSSRTQEQLLLAAKNLLDFIHFEENLKTSPLNLSDIAYTLQTGREAMEERVGFIVSSIDQLREKLQAYIEGQQDIEDAYQGQVKRNKEALAVFAGDEELQEAIEKWIERKKIAKLLDLWVKGFRFDWNKLYGDVKPRRISLPTYPFAKERYWYSDAQPKALLPRFGSSVSAIHPLLHENTSDLLEQRFTSRFTGTEFCLRDLPASGEKSLSGVSYLEMVRAALEIASRRQEQGTSIKLLEMYWAQPIIVNHQPKETHVGVFEENDGRLHYEIYSEADDNQEAIVHFTGIAEFHSNETPDQINVSDLQSQMTRGSMNADSCYRAFNAMGLEYAGERQGVQGIYQGERQVLAKLSLPASLISTQDDYVLHPSLLNSAIQSSIGLLLENESLWNETNIINIDLPTALESLDIVAACTPEMYAWVRLSDAINADTGPRLDIDLCSGEGVICAKLRGLEFDFSGVNEKPERRVTFLKKDWKPSALIASQQTANSLIVLHNAATKALAVAIKEKTKHALLIPENHIQHADFKRSLATCNAWIDLTGIARETVNSDWITLLQEVVEENRANEIHLLYVTQGLEDYQNTSISLSGADRVGLYRMLQAEYSSLRSRHLDLDPNVDVLEQKTIEILNEVSSQSKDIECCYRNGQRFTSHLNEAMLEKSHALMADFNDSDVVLVTGGTRGVGMLCAHHLVTKYGLKRLVLTGKEPLPPQNKWTELDTFSSSIQQKIKKIQQLQSLGAEVQVVSFPLDNLSELKQQYHTIQASMGNIVGIIHAAGLADGQNPAFIRKTPESIARIVSPKVEGLQNLMQLIDVKQLRFMLLFSSVSAVIPRLATGQSDYAMANAFMDYYASAQGAVPLVSIQWPSWKETGMGEATGSAYSNTGLLSITDKEGCELLDKVLANLDTSVIMPLIVDTAKFNVEHLMQTGKPAIAHPTPTHQDNTPSLLTSAPDTFSEDNKKTIERWLRSIFESELKLKREQLDSHAAFADYGVDSILLAQLLKRINKELNLDLEPSILLEHSTLGALSVWLQMNYSDVLAERLSLNMQTSKPDTLQNAVAKKSQITAPAVKSIPRTYKKPSRSRGNRGSAEQIAVVGMASRFPGASNIQEYWDLLSNGESAITAVPENCWGVKTDYHAGLLEDIYGFDPKFFMIQKEDAQAMDPQALVLLEESLSVIYHAGYTHHELAGKDVGVYIGARSQQVNPSQVENSRNPIMIVGQNYLAANISQFFNFRGPSLVLDTACSSSLVAMNMAVEAMRAGTIESALVGGVSLLTSPSAHEMFSKRNLLQTEGKFHILDQRASGVVLGEGCGMVYLKPLEKAKQDGDSIYAVIAGIGINNDGRTAGPATPNMEAQAAVMQTALKQSRCSIKDVGYLDVNGSGSEVTDLLEIKAVASVYTRDETSPLYLGAMKPNIGHPLCAEGIASFIKVALMLHHQQLVPFLSGQEPLKHYSIEDAGFAFPREKQTREMKYAALNCFADGGTNAHVILQQESLNTANIKRNSLPLPILHRVDVRTFEPLESKNTAFYNSDLGFLSHSFKRSKEWSLSLSSDHPILANHKVYEKELLPGLAWIDFLYQWFSEVGNSYKTLELKNLAIYRPLIVTDVKPVNLLVEATETNEGIWRIQVRDSLDTISEEEQKSLYITAEMHPIAPMSFEESVHIDEIISSSNAKTDIDQVYQHCQSRELLHSGVMKVEGSVYDTNDAIWVHAKVDEVQGNNKHDYRFHPALVDGSGVGTESLFSNFAGNEDRLFLPLFYESFIATENFGNECFTRIRKSSVDIKEELLSISMEFFAPDGRKIGELQNFKNKLVRNEGLINPDRQADLQGASSIDEAKEKGPQHAELSFDSMSSLVQSIVASKLGVNANEVALDQGYYELGLNSIILLEVSKALESILATSLSPTLLFEFTTIATLARFLENNYELPRVAEPARTAQLPRHAGTDGHLEETKVSESNTLPAPTTHSPLVASQATERSRAAEAIPLRSDIAVIGMSGRYPQASNLSEFWENLKEGKDCIIEIPEDRWDINHFDGLQLPSGKSASKWGGFIDDPYCFDNKFFRISAKEAETLDPQERLFLEVCWETMEDAGYTPANIVPVEGSNQRRPVGVFVGVMHKDYTFLQNEAVYEGQKIPLTLNDASIANRVSYLCNFHGPSMAVDTMCSSSLTAVHLAMESLTKGESKVALAGGVNLSLHPNKYLTYGIADIHASDSYCHTFGEGGDGYVSAEGVGAILLKPLQQAIADGDAVYAVLKGSTINHGGTNGGFTIPSPVAQGDMIADCLQKTGIDPASISYIEAHGTGTSLGDPIEIQGLNRAFREYTSKKQYCALGSVKSNMGHAEGAAGISALTKTILQLHHKTLVKSLHAEVINPYLDLPSSPFYVQQATEKWELSGTDLRRAGVSSFGATGSNAHIILEEFSSEEIVAQPKVEHGVLLPISAKNIECLQEYVKRILAYLQDHPETDLASLAFTLQTGRVEMEERLILCVTSIEETIHSLKGWLSSNPPFEVEHSSAAN